MIAEEDMDRIFAETAPGLDDEVKDYLLHGVLADNDSFEDLDTLRETLQSFIDDESVLNKLMEAIQRVSTANGADSRDADKPSLQTSFARTPGTDSGAKDDSVRRLAAPQTMSASVDISPTEATAEVSSEGNIPALISENNPTRQKKERRLPKHDKKLKKQSNPVPQLDNEHLDEHVTVEQWGGRGKGGRGEYAAATNSVKSNIHLTSVSILLDNGLDLLTGSPMDIVKGHRYGLIGRNGVGKSTLLRRLAQKTIPGLPQDMRIRLVQQHLVGTNESTLDVLVQADTDRTALLSEQAKVEARLESDTVEDEEVTKLVERLEMIATELDAIQADSIEERALEILRGLQFTDEMIYGPTKNLSGGWRMRVSLAQSLLTTTDLILYDECTNHLDLFGLDWLIGYLNSDSERTLIVVSHDTMFLDSICTDIVVLEHQRLTYHTGNYSEYLRQIQEKAARESQILDAAERQRASAQAFIQKQQAMANKKSADPNKQRQAKMMKEKKLERIGNYREDGKRYKQFSLATLSENSIRLAQHVQVETDDPVIKMRFPNPAWPPGIGENELLVCLEGFSFGYAEKTLLDDVTVGISRRTKAALVGVNGAGKSTLAKLVAGDLDPAEFRTKGRLSVHPNIRIGHVTQYAVEELEQFTNMTVVEYAEEKLRSTKAAAAVMNKASGNIRQYLGAFGLGGRHALQKIKQLSGGERMRLAFATVLADEPHLLCLDESTNHVDLETLDSMSKALNAFEGAVLMISHNQGFLAGFCNELWVLDKGKLSVKHSTESSFEDIFSEYRASTLQSGRVFANRLHKADLAKRASKQTTGRQYGVLM